MVCYFPVYQAEIPRLTNLLTWIRQLAGCKYHRAVIVADAATNSSHLFAVRVEAEKSFSDVRIISNKRPVTGWIRGANSLFLEAAQHASEDNQPWLFLESDAVPLKPRWLDTIEIHYRASGAEYLGAIVKTSEYGLPSLHMPGVSVYPPSAYKELAPTITSHSDKAFDMAVAGITSKKATASELFQHLWGQFNDPPRFSETGVHGTSVFGLNFIKPKAVLFHRTKDGSLIAMLRSKFGMNSGGKRYPFIQLGRYGDIILLLPALKCIADITGEKPKLIVSTDYATVLDGVSYVDPFPLPVNWYDGMPTARQFAKQHFGGGVILQCLGDGWSVPRPASESFMVSMIRRTGVPLELFHDLPLVFDRRSVEREKALIPKTDKPFVLVNTTGNSSPFPFSNQLFSALNRLSGKIDVVDMSKIRCVRIYDFIGLMDRAAGMITIDTATLHLAQASIKPFLALTVDGWCSSIPRGRCALEVKYSRFMNSLPTIVKTVARWI